MCFSTNAIEHLVYDMSKKIYENSIYKMVRIDFIGCKSVELRNQTKNPFSEDSGEECPLIAKLVLGGDNGTLYDIEPNLNGLKFAKGDITYKEYKNIQKGEWYQGFTFFSISIITILLVGWGMVEYLT